MYNAREHSHFSVLIAINSCAKRTKTKATNQRKEMQSKVKKAEQSRAKMEIKKK